MKKGTRIALLVFSLFLALMGFGGILLGMFAVGMAKSGLTDPSGLVNLYAVVFAGAALVVGSLVVLLKVTNQRPK